MRNGTLSVILSPVLKTGSDPLGQLMNLKTEWLEVNLTQEVKDQGLTDF